MNTLHQIRTALVERGYPISQIHLIDIVLAEVIDGVIAENQRLLQKIVAMEQAIYQLKTKGQSE